MKTNMIDLIGQLVRPFECSHIASNCLQIEKTNTIIVIISSDLIFSIDDGFILV